MIFNLSNIILFFFLIKIVLFDEWLSSLWKKGVALLDSYSFALVLKFNSKCMVQAGYMNQYVVKNAKVSTANTVLDQAENNNTLTIGLTYNFNLSKKE